MRAVNEDLWTRVGWPAMYVVTTNSVVTTDGRLVMGAGAAKQALDRIPGIDLECGRAVEWSGRRYQEAPGYGFLVVRPAYRHGKFGFGLLQTKYHYKDRSPIELVRFSIRDLAAWAILHGEVTVRVNYPGIGYGGLTKEQVAPLLELLPDNVTVCERR